ncbi:hypothetical protein [Alcanivorax sp.]|uniref:hypothetical protein n=1 Tax=Alcanivorax sp. TaxID=1872427 RepID=UPI0019A8BBA6|nr:hypothetical protein [Alcanivorax sp.]MBD3643541.1 hypothetical protein [Alcanivorax sp.]
MIEVEHPTLGIIEFPDGTSPEQMKAAIQKAEGGAVPAPLDSPAPAVAQEQPSAQQQTVSAQPESEEGRAWYDKIPHWVALRQMADAIMETGGGYLRVYDGESPADVISDIISKSPTSVPAELAASMGTGTLAQVAGGIAGIGKTVADGPAEGAEAVENVSSAMTYMPKAESSQEAMLAMEELGAAWEKLQGISGGAGEGLAKAMGAEPGSPEAGAAYAAGATLPDALAMLLPASKLKRAAPEPPPASIEELAKGVEVAGSDSKFIPGKKAVERAMAQEVRPEMETVRAFEDLGMPAESVPPEVLSGNEAFRELAGAARSVPASESSVRYGQFLENLKTKADELAVRAEVDDPSVLNMNVADEITSGIERARGIESKLYDQLDGSVRPDKKVNVTPITDKLLSRLDEVGGDVSELGGIERKLFKRFLTRTNDALGRPIYAPKEKTWSAMTGLRKELNAAREGKGGFGDAASYELDTYANAVSGTLKGIADDLGFGDTYTQAMQATGAKKAAQEAAQKVLGKQLDRSFTATFDKKMNSLTKGQVKEFDDAVKALPEDMREQAVKSMVYRKLFKQKDMDSPINISGFNQWYNELSSNELAKRSLYKHLDPQTRKDLNNLGRAVGAIKRANEKSIMTGRLLAAQEGFNMAENILRKVAGGVLRMTGLGSGAAGEAAASVLQTARKGKRLNIAASDLLGSPSFQRHVSNIVSDAKAGTLQKSEKALKDSLGWKRYTAALSDAEKQAIARMGVTAWLNSSAVEP